MGKPRSDFRKFIRGDNKRYNLMMHNQPNFQINGLGCLIVSTNARNKVAREQDPTHQPVLTQPAVMQDDDDFAPEGRRNYCSKLGDITKGRVRTKKSDG
jgi:hypothetical protein